MSHETFELGWLTLREPADHRARSAAISALLRDWWSRRHATRVIDLGSGAGSNLRYLGPQLPGEHGWTLVDHDEALLTRAEPPARHVGVTTLCDDLTGAAGLTTIMGADLVTASALLDLVSEGWLESLADACAAAGAAALFTLTYDGTIEWSEGNDPTDLLVRDAVNRHQRRDKGFGAALGPSAALAAEAAFRTRGFRTRLEPSPWELGRGDADLVRVLVEGWVSAAEELLPSRTRLLHEWAERRTQDVTSGRLRLTVGHVDLLALPPDSHAS